MKKGKEMTTERNNLKIVVLVLSVISALNIQVCADMIYDFGIFNNTAYENDPRLNFTLTISNEGLSWYGRQKVGFKFSNNSTATSSITDIYFDGRPGYSCSLDFDNVYIIEGAGVNFSRNAYPTALPGGELLTPAFDATPEYSADSDTPITYNGINPNEWLKLVFTLDYGKTLDDIINEIANGGSLYEQNLRVGIYIQSLPMDSCSYSDNHQTYCPAPPPECTNTASAINFTEPIPEPATIALLSLGALTVIRRKRNNK